MSKKDRKKGITDETINEIRTVGTLLQRINEELDRRKKEVETQDKVNERLLTQAVKEERGLIKEIDEAKGIVKEITADFDKIELDVETAARKSIEENVAREGDVRSGKTSLVEFRKKGKYDVKIAEETLTKSVQELESSLSVIRGKELEILHLRDKLGSVQNTIRGLNIRPGLSMRDLFKALYEFSDSQTASFMAELDSLKVEWNQTKQEIQLTEGKSMSGRYTWDRLTMKQARDLQFDPGFPLSCVKKLKSELVKWGETDNISITFYLNLQDIEITSIKSGRLPQITELKEDPNAKLKRIK